MKRADPSLDLSKCGRECTSVHLGMGSILFQGIADGVSFHQSSVKPYLARISIGPVLRDWM